MRNVKEIPVQSEFARLRVSASHASEVDALAAELDTNGIVALPSLLNAEQLSNMQRAFATRLRRMRWNNIEGYQKTEQYRHMVEDVLQLDQGFVDLALHPLVKQILTRYLGTNYELTEAKGWKSLPTKRDFHGWHGDAWYDQTAAKEIHREVKLAFYLTYVRTGAFNFIKGTHQKQHPRLVKNEEVKDFEASRFMELTGPAGTAFLFDTSGIHRQGVPMLEPRQAVFYNYHDPRIRLQAEDVNYYRYHPLLLNAAFLGDLSSEDQRILGFGNRTNFQPCFERQTTPPLGYRAFQAMFDGQLRVRELRGRITARLKKAFICPTDFSLSNTGNMPTLVSIFGVEPRRIGGTETFARELSLQLGKRGWQSVLCFLSEPTEEVRRFLDLPNISFDVYASASDSSLKTGKNLAMITRRYRPDVLHLHYVGFINLYSWIARLQSVKRVFFTDHHSRPAGYVLSRAPFWKRGIARFINGPLAKVICVSNYGHECMSSFGLLAKNRFQMIYNGVDLSRVKPRSAARTRLSPALFNSCRPGDRDTGELDHSGEGDY